MKNYTNADPAFSESISVYEKTDPANADDVLNVPLKQLQDNILWMKKYGTGIKGFLEIPTVTGETTFTYDGTAKSISFSGIDEDLMVVSGAEETNAGNYTAIVSLKNSAQYFWDDLTNDPKTHTWTIAKAAGNAVLSSSQVTLDEELYSTTVTVSEATGDVSVSSSDVTVATASIEGNTITITSPDGKTGTAVITVTVAASANYNATSKTITVKGAYSHIYGVSWDGTSTTKWSRTDAAEGFVDPVPAVNNGTGSSPFDEISPWKDMVKEERAGGTMVKIPKFYYKRTKTGKIMTVQISMMQEEGFSVSPMHMDRGDGKGERDVAYIGRYHCGATAYKSATGQMPKADIARATARSEIHKLGNDIYQLDYAAWETIQLLYLVEFADWNSQKTIGYGCGNNSSAEVMGSTDAMQYHTGTTAASRTTYGHTQYRNIEDPWGNVYDWCDGVYFNGADIYAIKNPANFSDSAGGVKVGTRPTSSGYISEYAISNVSGYEYFMYPSAVAGSESTYICDRCGYDSSGVVLHVGGSYNQYQSYGLFYLYGYSSASYSSSGIGSRLQELPSAA